MNRKMQIKYPQRDLRLYEALQQWLGQKDIPPLINLEIELSTRGLTVTELKP